VYLLSKNIFDHSSLSLVGGSPLLRSGRDAHSSLESLLPHGGTVLARFRVSEGRASKFDPEAGYAQIVHIPP